MEDLEYLKKSSGSNAAMEEFMAYKKSIVLTVTDVDFNLLFANHWGSPDCFKKSH